MTEFDLAELRVRMRRFVDVVMPHEQILRRWDDAALQSIEQMKREAKTHGLWALGHPREIVGGGLPLADFAYRNEITGRTYGAPIAVGSLSMQDAIVLHRFGTEQQQRRWLAPYPGRSTATTR